MRLFRPKPYDSLTAEEKLARLRKEHRRRERAWLKAGAKGRYPKRRRRTLAMVAMIPLMVVLGACNKLQVVQWHSDGSPKMVVEHAGDYHIDRDTESAYDRMCSLVGGCFGWTPPQEHYWHFDWVHNYIGAPGRGYWVHVEGGWHNFLNCNLSIPDTDEACNGEVAVTGVYG